jgi:hypothetical protein
MQRESGGKIKDGYARIRLERIRRRESTERMRKEERGQ